MMYIVHVGTGTVLDAHECVVLVADDSDADDWVVVERAEILGLPFGDLEITAPHSFTTMPREPERESWFRRMFRRGGSSSWGF